MHRAKFPVIAIPTSRRSQSGQNTRFYLRLAQNLFGSFDHEPLKYKTNQGMQLNHRSTGLLSCLFCFLELADPGVIGQNVRAQADNCNHAVIEHHH